MRGLLVFTYLVILFAIAVIDWNRQLIYNRFHIMILVLSVFSIWLFPEIKIGDRLIGALIISVPMFMLTLMIPGAFGGGDIKLMAVSGLFLGKTAIVCAMVLGLLTGGIFGVWMLKRGKLQRKDHFPFGPFLATGLAVAALWGNEIAAWYMQVL